MSINIILGPMFSGKTTELLRLIKINSWAAKKCILVKPNIDNRYNMNKVINHDGEGKDAIICSNLAEIDQIVQDYDVIGIDEGQFFSDIVEICDSWANQGKIIIIAALDGDFARKPFGSILNLVPKSEKVTKLNAVCQSCFNQASFTYRKVQTLDQTLIGGHEKYSAVCRKCYNQLT